MIEEIFIIDEQEKILYGDPARFPKKSTYPVHEHDGFQLMRFWINDVNIAILYRFLDKFSVLNHMHKLRNRLRKRLGTINSKNVQENYFLLFELLNKKEGIVHEAENPNFLPRIASNNAYVRVTEYHSVVIEGSNVILNRIAGNCFVSTVFNDSKTVKLSITGKSGLDKTVYKSDGVISRDFKKVEMKVKSGNSETEMFKYWIKDDMEPLVNIQNVEGGYVINCRNRTKFDYFEVFFPIPRTASRVVKSHSAGESVYDEELCVLRWKFLNKCLKRERIDYRVEMFEEIEDKRSITVKFFIKNGSEGKVRVEGAECVENSNVRFWIKYATCNGKYEVRMHTNNQTENRLTWESNPRPSHYE